MNENEKNLNEGYDEVAKDDQYSEPKLPESSNQTEMSTGQKATGIVAIIVGLGSIIAWIVVGIKKLVDIFRKKKDDKDKPAKEKKIKKAKKEEEPAEEEEFEIIEEETEEAK